MPMEITSYLKFLNSQNNINNYFNHNICKSKVKDNNYYISINIFRYAKMWYKGVSFTSEQCALVYLVDAAGTRTTTDSFSDMSQVRIYFKYIKSRGVPSTRSTHLP